MSLLKPTVFDGQIQRQVLPGDTLAAGESIPATVVTTNITVTGQQLMQGMILRNPAAPATDTLDTAANIIAAINAGLGNAGIPNGTTWRISWIVSTAQATTVTATANTGVTVTRGAIAASSGKEFLFTIINGTPAQTYQGATVNASAIVTLTPAQCATLTPGMIVTNAVANLQGQTIIGVNLGAGTVTMSGNANATATAAITFSPVVLLEGLKQGLI